MPTTDRIIEIAETSAFLSLENGLLKIRLPEREPVTIPVGEIQVLILANPAVTVTGAVLSALAENGVSVVVSGSNRLPTGMMLPLQGNYLQRERFSAQINAAKPLYKRLWQVVVKAKIDRQADLLEELCGNDFALRKLLPLVGSGDPQNIEGRAAVIYWKNFFGEPFLRDRDAGDCNVLFNYGYAVLRAMTARACCGAGLHPTIGINHHNRYDAYCLADDLMEPYRPVVDRQIKMLCSRNQPIPELDRSMRGALIKALLESRVSTVRGNYLLTDALQLTAEQTARSITSGEIVLAFP